MWQVSLISNQEKAYAIYGREYFPRVFRYKKEALELQESLKKLGVESKVEKG